MNTPSSRSGASARPIARCSAGFEPLLERQLHRRHVGIGIGELERHERAVIEAALGSSAAVLKPAVPSSSARAPASAGSPGAGHVSLIRLGRKAVIVVEHRRMGRCHHGRHGLFPMRRDDEQRARRRLGSARTDRKYAINASTSSRGSPISTNGHGPPPCGTKATGRRSAVLANRCASYFRFDDRETLGCNAEPTAAGVIRCHLPVTR